MNDDEVKRRVRNLVYSGQIDSANTQGGHPLARLKARDLQQLKE